MEALQVDVEVVHRALVAHAGAHPVRHGVHGTLEAAVADRPEPARAVAAPDWRVHRLVGISHLNLRSTQLQQLLERAILRLAAC